MNKSWILIMEMSHVMPFLPLFRLPQSLLRNRTIIFGIMLSKTGTTRSLSFLKNRDTIQRA